MSIDPNIQFVESIKKVFNPVFKEYGFELQEEVVWHGQLAERATTIRHYHNMGVAGIARYLDKDYHFTRIDVYNNEDLVHALEHEKEDLLKYCKDILSGDVSIWSEIVNRSEDERKGSGFESWSLS